MKKTILYVDDEEINLELFKANFEDDYNIITARSGAEGLSIAKSINEIDLIISDVKMPGMNGFEFISQVKKLKPNQVCVILSAFAASDFKNNPTKEKDIFKYLNKPWRRPEMNNTIIEAIDRNKSLQEAQ